MIDDIRHQKAKACVIWLVGQYSASNALCSGAEIEGIHEWTPDVLRRTAKSFCAEVSCFIKWYFLVAENYLQTPDVKLQIITLASKLLVLNPEDRILRLLGRHVFSLARYDPNYDVRDRARLLSTLLAGIVTNLLTDDDEMRTEKGGVVLRQDQVRMVLFDGKAAVVENYFQGGTLPIS
jgi:AP-3 complex subunit beta